MVRAWNRLVHWAHEEWLHMSFEVAHLAHTVFEAKVLVALRIH